MTQPVRTIVSCSILQKLIHFRIQTLTFHAPCACLNDRYIAVSYPRPFRDIPGQHRGHSAALHATGNPDAQIGAHGSLPVPKPRLVSRLITSDESPPAQQAPDQASASTPATRLRQRLHIVELRCPRSGLDPARGCCPSDLLRDQPGRARIDRSTRPARSSVVIGDRPC